MAATSQPSPLSGLARALVQAGKLSETEAEALTSQAAAMGASFIQQLVAAQKMTAGDVARFASDTFGFPLLDLNAYDDAHLIKDAIDPKLVATHRVIPLYKRGNRLSIATADPTNLRALDEIRFQTGLVVDPIVVREDQLAPLAAKLAESADTTLKNLVNENINLEFDEGQSDNNNDN